MDNIILKDKSINIDGLEYPCRYPENYRFDKCLYCSNSDKLYNKKNIRVYNPKLKQHCYLEWYWPNIGDTNLLFVTFPRTDGPVDSWSSSVTQHVNITTWTRENMIGEFVRFRIISINEDNYCRVSDNWNYKNDGIYARDAFYKINKIFEM